MSILALLAILLPGLAWWAWLGRREQDPLVSLAQILGVSLALISLLAEGVFLLGSHFTLAGLLILLVIFLGLAVFGLVRRPWRLPKKHRLYLIIGLTLFGLTLAWRLYQARDLILPNWVDSQHHYLIVRAILEKGGLPETLDPYLPVPFYYHFGFHAAAALFTVLSRLSIGEGMLIFGQILNAAISLSVYALGRSLWRDWRPAAAGALLVSFATRMPAYYLSWGRYTLATGLILLPLAMGLALRLLSKDRNKWETLTLGLLTAGVLLSHYFAGFLLAIFLIFLAIAYLIPRWNRPLTALLRFSSVPVGTALGLLLTGPWLLRVAKFSAASTQVSLNPPASVEALFNGDRWHYIWQLLSPPSNHWLLLAAGVGIILGLTSKKTLGFALWSLALGLLSLPLGQNLGPFRPDHFAIVLFLPVAAWAGWLFWRAGHWLGKRLGRRWVSIALPALLVCAWIAWGFHLSADIVNPVTTLVTPADLRALEWVEENTPEDARFFINTTHWLGGVYRGVDGGGWLLPYAGRWSLVPTVFYGFSPDREVKRELIDWGKRASEITGCSEEFWALVEEAEINFVYIREGSGSLQANELLDCSNLKIIYLSEKIAIFKSEVRNK